MTDSRSQALKGANELGKLELLALLKQLEQTKKLSVENEQRRLKDKQRRLDEEEDHLKEEQHRLDDDRNRLEYEQHRLEDDQRRVEKEQGSVTMERSFLAFIEREHLEQRERNAA